MSAKHRFPLYEKAHTLSDLADAIQCNIAKGPGQMMGFRRRGIHELQLEGKARGQETKKRRESL